MRILTSNSITGSGDTFTGTLKIDQNDNANSINIDSEATSATVIAADLAATTTGNILSLQNADSLTTGSIAQFHSNSANTTSRNIVRITNANVLATGATCLELNQSSAQRALFIDQNGNAAALVIDSEATGASLIDVSGAQTASGNIILASNADNLTTGSIINVHSNSANTSTRDLTVIRNQNTLATGAKCLKTIQDAAAQGVVFEQNGAGTALTIDQNGNGQSINIDSEATNVNVFNISPTTVTTGNIINISDADSLSTGSIANFVSNSADTGSRFLVSIHNDNAAATNSRCLRLIQDAARQALFIDMNDNSNAISIDSEATTADVIDIASPTNTTGNIINITNANSLTTGKILELSSNSANTGTRQLANITNDNTLATGTSCLRLQQDAAKQAMAIAQNAASSFIDYQGTAAANTTDPISTLTTSGATTHHIQIEINGVKAWVAASTTNPS